MMDQTMTMAMMKTARILKEHPGQPTADRLVVVAVVAEDVVVPVQEQPPTRGRRRILPVDLNESYDIHNVC